jgi:hypothetical protein
VAEGVACVVADFVTVRGVGEGFGGAIVRVRVEGAEYGSVVELFEFCADPKVAQANVTTMMATSLFMQNLRDTALVT